MIRKITALVLLFALGLSAAAHASAVTRYEYKLVPLGSLSVLQKTASEAKMSEIEKRLNEEGHEGWEMVNIFAVRTTFDPNVFFAAMKRPLPDLQADASPAKGGGQR